jgi:hypothetical protein
LRGRYLEIRLPHERNVAKLDRPTKPRSQDAGAVVKRGVFDELGVDPSDYPKYCSRVSDGVRVKISPAALDHLEQLSPNEQDSRVVAALPFAAVNGRPRIWATDFALLDGERTSDEVRAWYRRNRVRMRSQDVGSLRLPGLTDGAVVGEPQPPTPPEPKGVVRRVPPERRRREPVVVPAREGHEMYQREQELVDDFIAHLRSLGREPESLELAIEDAHLRNDIFVADRNQLVEAKSGDRRELVRMAIGQIFDYRYCMALDASYPGEPDVATLLPTRPRNTILELLDHLGIGVVWRDDDEFDDNTSDKRFIS